ncbi:hypothetical protein AC249_AIPGENE743 [Exaiptasia diaphana]|nr:hypothetical protein AC249_AIPGENE743 [Exaiptasia diaphana]
MTYERNPTRKGIALTSEEWMELKRKMHIIDEDIERVREHGGYGPPNNQRYEPCRKYQRQNANQATSCPMVFDHNAFLNHIRKQEQQNPQHVFGREESHHHHRGNEPTTALISQ